MKKLLMLLMLLFAIVPFALANYEPKISAYEVRPCTGNTWNTSYNAVFKIKVTACNNLGVDCDQVSARAVLYKGENATFEQDTGWQAYQPSGTTFTLNFANMTTSKPWNHTYAGTFNLYLYGKNNDTETWDSEVLPYSVETGGIEYTADCVTNSSAVPITPPDPGNVMDNSIGAFEGYGWSKLVVWFIIIIVIDAIIWFSAGGGAGGVTLGIILFLDFIMVAIGVYLGWINILFVLLPAILIAVIIGYKLFNKWFQ
jgi:hypothetical protein